MDINKKYIVDEQGNPTEVIIPIDDFRKIEELLGGISMMKPFNSSVRLRWIEKKGIKRLK